MCKFFPRKGNAWKSLYLWCLSRKKQKYAQHGHTRIVASWSPQLKRRFEFQSNQDFLRSRFERTVAYNLPPVSTFPNASATLQARYSRDCFQWERVLECIQFGLSLRSKPLLAKRSITGCFKAAQQTCTKSQTAAHGLDHVQEGRVPRVPFAARAQDLTWEPMISKWQSMVERLNRCLHFWFDIVFRVLDTAKPMA